jgi:hypothetical protein
MPVDHDAVQMALRAQGLPVIVATTGLATLAATTTGFTRTIGSFVDDKFARGMEIVSAGFGPAADNVKSIITSVTPQDLRATPFVITVTGGVQSVTHPALIADPAASGRMLIAGFPFMVAWENMVPSGLTVFTPIAGIPYIEDEYSPSTNRVVTTPRSFGKMEAIGDYIFKWHGIPGVGSSAIRRSVDALKLRYPPGLELVAGANKVIVSGDPAPEAGGIVQVTSGPIIILTIPWVVRSRNAVLTP